MVLGIGTDIVEIERLERSVRNEAFMRKCFTASERAVLDGLSERRKTESAAGYFAAKESVAKALGTGFVGFGFVDIEIMKDARSKPYVVLHGGAAVLAEEIRATKIHVTISHCGQYATAFAVCEG